MGHTLPLRLQEDAAGVRTWSVGEISASLLPSEGGWRLRRASGPDLLLPPEASLSVEATPGEQRTVARLESPLLMLPETERTIWLAWPMVLLVRLGEGGPVLEQRRPAARKTVLGPVDHGTVLPALRTALLAGPGDPALPLWTHAALRVVVENRTADAVQLRRMVVLEPALALFLGDDRLALGDLHIRVQDSQTAEAVARAGAPPEGYLRVGPETTPLAVPALSWLLDATHRSVEFAL